MKSILVTGGAGFIGSNIADVYLKNGNNVVIVDNLSTGKIENVNTEACFYKIDITDKSLEQVFKNHKINIVNHHAAQIDVRKSVSDPYLDASVNIMGLINLLQFSVKYGVENFIFASSGGVVYGEPEYLPVDINHRLNPLSPYGVSKLSSEFYIKTYKYLHDLNYAILRYGNVYGPRQDPHGEAGVIAIFIQRLLEGKDIDIFGDGNQLRDYVFIDDVVKANINATEIDDPIIVNIGTGIGTSVNELSDFIISAMKRDANKAYKPHRPGELAKIYLKPENNILNWSPETNITEGLDKTIKYFSDKQQESGN